MYYKLTLIIYHSRLSVYCPDNFFFNFVINLTRFENWQKLEQLNFEKKQNSLWRYVYYFLFHLRSLFYIWLITGKVIHRVYFIHFLFSTQMLFFLQINTWGPEDLFVLKQQESNFSSYLNLGCTKLNHCPITKFIPSLFSLK